MPSTVSPPSTAPWRPPWRRVDRWLARHQTVGRVGATVATGMLLLLAAGLVLTARAWLRTPGSQGRYTILPPPTPDELPPPRLQLAAPAADAAPAASPASATVPLATPAMVWDAPPLLNAAAELLTRHDDVQAALALLLAHGAAPRELQSVGLAGYAQIDEALRQRLAAAWPDVQAAWAALPPAEQAALCPPPGPPPVLATLLAEPAPPVQWPALTAALPPSLAYALHHRLVDEVTVATRLPQSVVRLALALRTQPPALLHEALAATPETRPAAPLAEHLATFQAVLDEQLLPALAQPLLDEERGRVAAAAPALREWYRLAWGDPFLRLLENAPAEGAALPRLQATWAALPPALAPCWARELLVSAAPRWGALPPACTARSAWLLAVERPLPKAELLQLLRRHPAWQAELADFRYDAALATGAPAAIAALHAQPWSLALRLALSAGLDPERKLLLAESTRWDLLADLVGVSRTLPGPVAAARNPHARATPLRPYTYATWAEVPAEQLCQRLANPPRNQPHRDTYRQLAALLAINRGLALDARENQAYPPLQLDPPPSAAQP